MTKVEACEYAIHAVIDSEFITKVKFDILESMFTQLSIERSMERMREKRMQEGKNDDAV